MHTSKLNHFPNFKSSEEKSPQNENNKPSLTDEYIQATEKLEKKETEGSFTLTGTIPLYVTLLYGIKEGFNIRNAKQTLSKEQYKKLLPKLAGKILAATAIGTAASIAINFYLNSKTEQNYNKIKQKFNQINTDTNAVLADNMFCKGYAYAAQNPVSGKIQVNKNVINDPILGRTIDKLLKHELVHARQYETVARTKDGIRKINFAEMNKTKKLLEKVPDSKEMFAQMNTEISKNPDKYNDKRIRFAGGGAEVSLKDYVSAINTLMNNPNAGLNDIPIVIDAKHYQAVIDKKEALSPQEEAKADEYYKAMLEYTPANSFIQAYNPWSSYRQNILEKEAYKENPDFITKLSDMFV